MPVEYICDGCGNRKTRFKRYGGQYIKPLKWYSRRDKDGEQLACSHPCIEKVAEKTGKTSVVLPF